MSFYFIMCRQHSDKKSIILHGRRTTTLERYKFFVNDFYPFMGVLDTPKNRSQVNKLLHKKIIIRWELVNKDNDDKEYYDQHDQKVILIYLKSTDEFEHARKKFEGTYQDDVPFIRVFRTKKNIRSGFVITNHEDVLNRERMSLFKHYVKMKKYFNDYILVSHHEIIGF